MKAAENSVHEAPITFGPLLAPRRVASICDGIVQFLVTGGVTSASELPDIGLAEPQLCNIGARAGSELASVSELNCLGDIGADGTAAAAGADGNIGDGGAAAAAGADRNCNRASNARIASELAIALSIARASSILSMPTNKANGR